MSTPSATPSPAPAPAVPRTFSEGLYLGDLLKYEAPCLYSRDAVVVLAGQSLTLGAVLGMVTATGKVAALDPTATDGRQVACGVLIQDCDATAGDQTGLMVARHAVVADVALAWPAGIADAERTAAVAQLKALGVIVRRGV